MNSKTSIVSTLGPASNSLETISALLNAGVSMFRLNFSHGTFENHGAMLDAINQARAALPYSIAVMGDLCGPKIRIGQVAPDTVLEDGDEIEIHISDAVGNASLITTDFTDLIEQVQTDQRILIDDGQLVLGVLDKTDEKLKCKVLVGGPLSSRKGMNLPDTDLSVPPITEKDWQCVDWAVEHELDYLSLSFVQRADEIISLKDYVQKKNSTIKVIAKIEKPLAVKNIESIINASDGIMVARGDLGVEMDLAQVPLVQKRITGLCRSYAKPVIVATQVLQSMIEHSTPTRAEATDVSNAVIEYADAVMLSGETAVGKYPVQSVKTLVHVCESTERYIEQLNEPRPRMDRVPELRQAQAVARAVAQMLDEVQVSMVVVWAQNEAMCRLLSKARIDDPIIAMCADRITARQLSLLYGLISVHHSKTESFEQWVADVDRIVVDNNWASKGQALLLIPPMEVLSESTNGALILHTIT